MNPFPKNWVLVPLLRMMRNGFIAVCLLFGDFLFATLEDLSDLNAHGVALGGAVLTLGSDGNAVVGNPALLSTQPLLTLGLTSHVDGAELLNESIFSGTLQAVLPLGAFGGIGAAMTSVLNAVTEGGAAKILFADYQANLGYGFSLLKQLQIGASLHARAIHVDPGLSGLGDYRHPLEVNATVGVFSAPIKYLAFALVASRFLPPLGTAEFRTDNRLSPAIRLAVGTRNPIFLGEAGLEYLTLEKQFALALGLERFFFKNIFRVSLGMRIAGISGDFTPGAGLGLRLGRFTLDYAFTYPLSGVLRAGSHIATVGIQL